MMIGSAMRKPRIHPGRGSAQADSMIEGRTMETGRSPPEIGNRWPKVTSFPNGDELSAALDEKIDARILLLDADAPGGYVRDWAAMG